MSPINIGLIGFSVLFFLLALGLPVGAGMAIVGFTGLWYFLGGAQAIAKVGITAFSTVNSYDLAVLPLFLLMANVCFVSGIIKDLFNLAYKWLGNFRGGLSLATIAACAGFASVSASSLATAATMGQVAIPEMKRYNYHPSLATGSVAAGGTMGILIPPSGALILYGILTETSIGKLFIAGIIPGIIEALFYFTAVYVLCTWKPNYGPRGPSFSFREKIAAFGSCGEITALVLLILGGLIIGWFTPTEAGAVGAFGAIFITLIRKRLDWPKLKQAVYETAKTTGMIYLILIGAFIFMPFIALSNIPFWLADFVSGLSLPPLAIMALIILVYLILGCFLDVMAMILLTIPIFFPLAMGLGFDPLWFGIIIVAVMEIASITPPIGMNVFIIAGVAPDVPLQSIFKGIVPFLIADVCRITLYLLVPAVALYLPSLMG
jgi:C4-dicarboxylate transporter DctM subunit